MATHAETTGRSIAASQRRQATFLERYAQGLSIAAACRETGVAENTYYKWRKRWPMFAAQADTIRANREHGRQQGAWRGKFAEWQAEFIPAPEGGLSVASPMRMAVVNALENTKEGQITLCLLPPGTGKTTAVENWVLHQWAEVDRNLRFLNISKGQTHQRKTISRLKQLMTDPVAAPKLIAAYGPWKEDGQERRGLSWAADYFTLAGRTVTTRDYSMAACGLGGQIYGSRAEIVLLDDPQDLRNIAQTDQFLHQFQQEIITRRPGPGRGRIIIIMTRIGVGDFAEAITDADLVDNLVRIPIVDHHGNTNDPIVFPQDQIANLRRQVGEDTWWCAYMQRPRLGENATFAEADIAKAKRPAICVGQREAGTPVIFGLDPNLGSGYTSIIDLACWTDKIRVLDSEERYALSRTEQVLRLVEEHAIRYRPQVVRIEHNRERGLTSDDRMQALAARFGFKIVGHQTGAQKNSLKDADLSVTIMANAFIAGEIEIPWHDDGAEACPIADCVACTLALPRGFTRSRMEPLLAELLAWRPYVKGRDLKQDRVMALWFAWLEWTLRFRKQTRWDDSKWRTTAAPRMPRQAYRQLVGARGGGG